MFKLILISFMSVIFAFAHAKEAIVDPMRPPGKSALKISKQQTKNWKLTAILVSPERRMAVINNKLISVGEKVAGARVKVINSNSVELEVDGKRLTLRPVSTRVRKPRL